MEKPPRDRFTLVQLRDLAADYWKSRQRSRRKIQLSNSPQTYWRGNKEMNFPQSKRKKSVPSLTKLLQTCHQKDKKFLRHSTRERLALCPRKLPQIHPQKDKKCVHRSTWKKLALHSQKLPQTYQQKNEDASLPQSPRKHPVSGEKLIWRLHGRGHQVKALLPSNCYSKMQSEQVGKIGCALEGIQR